MGEETLGVIPVLVGPLQALVALLPAIGIALGGAILALFRPATLKQAARILWRLKISAVSLAAGGFAFLWLLRTLLPADAGVVATEEGTGDGWRMFRGGLWRSGAQPGSPAPTQGGLHWAFASQDRTFHSSPAIAGNRVYATSIDYGVFADKGAIYCLDADSGALVWKTRPSGYRSTFSSPAVQGRYLVVGEGLHFARDARVLCLDVSRQGEVVWEHRTRSHVESTPCIDQGRVYIGAGDDGYYCFALEPGADGGPRVLWHAPGDLYRDAESSPAVWEGKVYVGLGMGGKAVCCLDALTGKELWRVPTPYPAFGPPTVVGGKVFVGMGNGNFIEEAEALRSRETERLRKLGKSLAEIDEAEEALGPAGEVWCFDAITGALDWRFRAGRTILGAVAADEGRLVFGSRDGFLYVLSHDGKELGRWNAHAPLVASPALAQDHVYVLTETGKLFGLRLEDLKPVWEATIGTVGPFLSSPAVARGRVYVGSQNDGLVCVGSPANLPRDPVWSGALGGGGKGGSIDSSPLPPRGAFLWRYPAEGSCRIDAPAAAVGDRLYVGISNGPKIGLACLRIERQSRKTPAEMWFFETRRGVSLSAAASRDLVFVVDGRPGEADRRLYALDPISGSPRWEYPVEAHASGHLTMSPDRLVVQSDASGVSCLDFAGKFQWRCDVGELAGAPAFSSSLLVMAVRQPPCLMGMDLPTGRVLWTTPLESHPISAPAIRGKSVYIGMSSGLSAHRLVDGARRWTSGGGPPEGPFSLGRDFAAYVCAGSDLNVVDLEDGTIRARRPGAIRAIPPVVARDRILFATPGGLVSYDVARGAEQKWMDVAWLGSLTSPVIMADSCVYFATDRKGLIRAGQWK